MSAGKSLAEQAIDLIAKRGSARSTDIGEALDKEPTQISAVLAPEVESGLLLVCKVTGRHGRQTNEYRLAGHVAASHWQDFRISKRTKVSSLPAPAPAAQQKVADKVPVSSFPGAENLCSTRSGSPTEARAVAANPVPEAGANAAGTGDHVGSPSRHVGPIAAGAKFALWDDGRLVIHADDEAWILPPEDTRRLARFILDTHEACIGARP